MSDNIVAQQHLAITSRTAPADAARVRQIAAGIRDRWQAQVDALRAQGVTGLRCPDCGHVHEIARVQMGCNAHTDDGVCESSAALVPVFPALSLSNGLGGTATVRYSVNGAAQ